MANELQDKVQELLSKVEGIDPKLLAAGAGALGGGVIGGLSGLGGKRKGRLGRMAGRAALGSVLGGGVSYGGLLLKQIMDRKSGVAADLALTSGAKPDMLGEVARKIREGSEPVRRGLAWVDKKFPVGAIPAKVRDFWTLAPEVRAANQRLVDAGVKEQENMYPQAASDTVLGASIVGAPALAARVTDRIGDAYQAATVNLDKDGNRTDLPPTDEEYQAYRVSTGKQPIDRAETKRSARRAKQYARGRVDELLAGLKDPADVQSILDKAYAGIEDGSRRGRVSQGTIEGIPGLLEALQQGDVE